MPRDGDIEHKDQQDVDKDDEERYERLWFYVSAVLGFILGFWAVFSSLAIKKSWRYAYFCFVNEKKYKLYMVIMVNMACLRWMFEA